MNRWNRTAHKPGTLTLELLLEGEKKPKHLKPLCDGVFFFIFIMKNIKLIAKFKKLYSGQPYAHSLNLPLTFYYTLKKITNLSIFSPNYPSIRLSHFFGHNSKYIAGICILFLSTLKTEFTWRTKQRWAFQAKETSYTRAMKHCIQVGGCSILRIAIVSICLQLRVMMWGQPKMSIKSWPGGFPGGAVVENLPANAGDTGLSPGLGRSHMPRSNWASEPQLLSLRVWSLCSATREARALRWRVAPARRN